MALEEGFSDAEAERRLREKLAEHDFLVDLWQMGEQMRGFAETPVGVFLISEFRQDFNEALAMLLECESPDTDAARQAFWKAKTAWNLLGKIEGVLAAGQDAEKIMLEADTRGDTP